MMAPVLRLGRVGSDAAVPAPPTSFTHGRSAGLTDFMGSDSPLFGEEGGMEGGRDERHAILCTPTADNAATAGTGKRPRASPEESFAVESVLMYCLMLVLSLSFLRVLLLLAPDPCFGAGAVVPAPPTPLPP